MTAHVAPVLRVLIPGTASIVREKNARPVSLHLTRGEVHRLDRTDGVLEIQVLDGVVWLTTTPADGDRQLRATDRFSPAAAWPIVFEALQDASVLLLR